MPSVRPADSGDVGAIVGLLRAGFPAELLPYTIAGCDGYAAYVADSIAYQDLADAKWYVLCNGDREVHGFLEVRVACRTLFSNQLYVSPKVRAPGVGTNLWLRGLQMARNSTQTEIVLDVFEDNHTAKRAYTLVGFATRRRILWAEVETPAETRAAGDPWYVKGMALADHTQQRFGFSEFVLETLSGTYPLGRIGDRLFRTTTDGILSDPCALGALHTLDHRRKLLCISEVDSLQGKLPEGAIRKAKSLRMTAPIDDALNKLAVLVGS